VEPLEILGTYNDDDRRAVRQALASLQARRAWAWWALTIALMSFSLLVDQVTPALLRWLPGACGLGMFCVTYFIPRPGNPFLGDVRVTFNETHVEAESNGALIRYPWSRVSAYRVETGVVLIRLDAGANIPLVRRWADPPRWQRALDILRQRSKPS
jgi:hypothetical protein